LGAVTSSKNDHHGVITMFDTSRKNDRFALKTPNILGAARVWRFNLNEGNAQAVPG